MEIIIIILLLILLGMDVYLLIKVEFKREQMTAKPTKPKLTKEEKDKQEQLRKSFDNLMNYDESAARHRK